MRCLDDQLDLSLLGTQPVFRHHLIKEGAEIEGFAGQLHTSVESFSGKHLVDEVTKGCQAAAEHAECPFAFLRHVLAQLLYCHECRHQRPAQLVRYERHVLRVCLCDILTTAVHVGGDRVHAACIDQAQHAP